MSTGVAYLGSIDSSSLQMTVTADGAPLGTYPVSLGAPDTPTARGVKVIMEKGLDIRMSGPGYDDPHVKFTQRLTYGGEYLHSAPWNVGNIGRRSTSNGCTNLLPADAETLYNTFEIGDVFDYPNADGPPMDIGAGYGDWNLTWPQWQTGGLFPPDAQAVTQTRIVAWSCFSATSGTITRSRRASQTPGSRKKPVTWISRSSARLDTSPGVWRSMRA